jgi:hypothetical protein
VAEAFAVKPGGDLGASAAWAALTAIMATAAMSRAVFNDVNL